MEWFSFDGVPWLGVLLAFVVASVMGWFWYSPRGFFRPWQRAVGFTDAQMEGANMGLAFGQMVVGNVLGLIVLAALLLALGIDSWWAATLTGGVLGFAFRGGAHMLHDGFAMRGPVATWIDTAHDTLALTLSGLPIGLFR
ncbi:MAG: DUF1761 domain-containing protein [Demequina sp.]